MGYNIFENYKIPTFNINDSIPDYWVHNGMDGSIRNNRLTRQTEYVPAVISPQSNKVMSALQPPEPIVFPQNATKNTPATPPPDPNDNDNNKINKYDSYGKTLEGTGHILAGTGSLVNAGVNIWNAIEQSKLNKEQMANLAMQRKVWEEQISSSREARTQRKQELARLNKMRSNTKAQFNTQATVTRSY